MNATACLRTLSVIVGSLLLVVHSPVAQAQPDSQQPTVRAPGSDEQLDRAARLTFEAGRQAFANGNYEEALARFQQAYSLSPRPILLYNIALALDRLRQDDEALAKFREYLSITLETAPERTQVEARIRALETAIEERLEREAELEAQGETVVMQGPVEEEGGGLPPFVVIAVGGAAVVAAGVTLWSGLDANSKNDEFETYAMGEGAEFARAQQLFDDTTSAESRTNILIGVSGALAATAVTMIFFTDWEGSDDEDEEVPESETTATVAVHPTGLSLGLAGTL